MLKLTTKSQIEFGQARYYPILVQLPIVITSASLAANLLLCAGLLSAQSFSNVNTDKACHFQNVCYHFRVIVIF